MTNDTLIYDSYGNVIGSKKAGKKFIPTTYRSYITTLLLSLIAGFICCLIILATLHSRQYSFLKPLNTFIDSSTALTQAVMIAPSILTFLINGFNYCGLTLIVCIFFDFPLMTVQFIRTHPFIERFGDFGNEVGYGVDRVRRVYASIGGRASQEHIEDLERDAGGDFSRVHSEDPQQIQPTDGTDGQQTPQDENTEGATEGATVSGGATGTTIQRRDGSKTSTSSKTSQTQLVHRGPQRIVYHQVNP